MAETNRNLIIRVVSALVLLPGQVSDAKLAMGVPERPEWPAKQNYGVITVLVPRPGVRRLCLALVDFLPTTWMQAKARLVENVPRVQERLGMLVSGKESRP